MLFYDKVILYGCNAFDSQSCFSCEFRILYRVDKTAQLNFVLECFNVNLH